MSSRAVELVLQSLTVADAPRSSMRDLKVNEACVTG